MPHKDIDAVVSEMFEPIEFLLDGKEYKITKIEARLVAKLQGGAKVAGASPTAEDFERTTAAMEEICGVEPGAFMSVDMLKLSVLTEYICSELEKQFETFMSKKSPEAGATPQPS